MRNVEIEIFLIAKTQVQFKAVQDWLAHLGAEDYAYELCVERSDAGALPTDPALLIALAAKRCYNSFEVGLNPNVTKIRKDFTEYLDNILKSGHGSVLEHSSYTFAIEGVSRVFTGEMNRHRAGVGISEASMRYIRYTDIPFWMPTCLRLTEEEQKMTDLLDDGEENSVLEQSPELEHARKKKASQRLFAYAFRQAEDCYKKFQDIWKDELGPDSKFRDKKHMTSCGRRIIPMGVATGGVWTLNMRALRHVMAMRASEAAEEEIFHVFSRIAKIMVDTEPMLFGDFVESPEGYWVPKYKKV